MILQETYKLVRQSLQNLTMRYCLGRCGAGRINSPSGTAAL